MAIIPLDDKLLLTPPRANIDARYKNASNRPYATVALAENAIDLVEGNVGLTVLVADENDPDYPKAKEYWVQPYDNNGVTAYHLVEKDTGVTDYEDLENLPKINNVELKDSKTASDLGLATAAQGDKANTAIQGVSVNGTEVTPDPTTKKVALTIENGKSAYEVYVDNYKSEHEGSAEGAMTESEWLESLKGEKGDSGHNPCLGRLNILPADLDAAFPNAIAGDYIYVDSVDNTTTPPTTTTTVYHYVDSTTGWDSGTAIEVNDATFTSGQSVSTLPIKDLDGQSDPTATGVLSADAGKKLSDKVVTEKVNYPVDKNSYTEVGFYRPAGTYSDSTSYVNTGFVRIDNVRNLTLTVNSRSSSCAPVTFWDANKVFISGVTPSSTSGVQTFNVAVPSDAKYAIFSHHETASWFDDFSLLSYLYVNSLMYQGHCYLSLNGDDDNDGLDSEHPVQTVGRAKSLIGDDGTLFIMEGEYDNYEFDFSSFAKIIGVGSVVFSKYQKKITSASLASGYTRVYEYQDQSVIIPDNMYHIWQHDIPDANTLISDADRHPLQKNKTHRMPSTRLYKADSIAEIESTTNKQMFYYDSTTRTTYFSIVEGSNLGDNPVVIPVNNTKYYSAKSKKKVYIENIAIKYCGFRTKNLYGEIVNMSVGMNYGAGAFMFDDTTDLVVRGCEGYGAYTPTAGDGFNTTGNAQFGLARIYMFDCWGHDNADDGESCHQYCLVIQRGGLFEYNGSGCTPAAGGHGEYYNVTCRYNGGWDWVSDNGGSGFSAQGKNDAIGATVMKCYNCVSVGNHTNYRTTNSLNQPASACYGCVSIDPSNDDFDDINHYGSVIVHNGNS